MKASNSSVQQILLSLIDRPATPDRITIDSESIKELAASILEVGLKQPILLRPIGSRFEIVAGDRRYQACLSLSMMKISAFVEEMTDEKVSILRATENLQRLDLSIIEEAQIYFRLHNDHGLSWDQIAKKTGKSVGNVKRRVDLLRMPEILIKALHEKKIGYAVAEELERLKDLGRLEYYLGYCVDHGATKEVVANWVREELAMIRQHQIAGGGSEWGTATLETKPIYVACDCCMSAMELKEVVYMRICPVCHKTIKSNM